RGILPQHAPEAVGKPASKLPLHGQDLSLPGRWAHLELGGSPLPLRPPVRRALPGAGLPQRIPPGAPALDGHARCYLPEWRDPLFSLARPPRGSTAVAKSTSGSPELPVRLLSGRAPAIIAEAAWPVGR